MDDDLTTSGRGPTAEVGAAAVKTGSTPKVDLPQVRQVTIHLVTGEASAACPFWVGLAGRGSLSPLQLLDFPLATELFAAAAGDGINAAPPLLLFDSNTDLARSIFLMPIPEPTFRARTLWVHELAESLSAWTHSSLGFYFAPEAVTLESGVELLQAVLRQMIQQSITNEFYLLTGRLGINPLLNAALRLKGELQGEKLDLYVYH